MKWTDALKNIVKVVAPGIATAAGGPLAGTVTSIVLNKLGLNDEAELEKTLAAASPETLLKLKEAEMEFQQTLAKLEIEGLALDNADRDSARKREIQMRDWTPSVLAAVITVGFFGVLLFMLLYGLPENGEDALLVMLGSLGTAWAGVVSYFFGSSAGSRNKQVTIDAALGKR